ncbi:hypothetical protein CIHG_02977 [Coccidioides immitis H538.4]|uniref:Clu domain-containing protein n=1 Tax=Coccidioides immitis H538.4 TaxID=396776 RepID=A0A0J8RMK1_COCIT|nr:hypothetical protein CIHG_02977 [Coccidioides immitis H538.4]
MGVKAVNQLDIAGLFTPGTMVIDYLGKRVVGQSIVPGIFKQREPGEHQIDYGGVDGKDVIAKHEAFVPVFEKLSKALRVKKHPVWDKDGARHELESSVETKGLLGTDGRNKPNGEAADASENAESEKKETTSPDQERVDISDFKLALNPDVFSGQVPQTDEEKEEWAQDEKEVRDACNYLRSKVLPELIQDLHDGDVGFPMDGQSLSQLLHKRGINVRYLGKLAALAKEKGARLQALTALMTQDMIARAFKHIANRYLRNLPSAFATSCIAHLLNCLLGTEVNSKPRAEIDESLREIYPEGDFSFEQLGAKNYAFDRSQLKNQDHSPAANGTRTPEEGGKKKKKKGSDQASPRPAQSPAPAVTFVPDDILNIVPIVKDASPRSALSEEALEAGRISLMQNQKELGQELILESLSLHEQIYGILHPEVAKLYHQLSMLYYQSDDKDAAVELARKAVIVTERTMGVDSADAILSYLNLSLFEHATGNTKVALVYIRHALELWKIIYGPNHPDSITTMNNAAVMLQHLKLYPDSRKWFEASLTVCEELFGRQSVNTATILFQLAQALALDQDS